MNIQTEQNQEPPFEITLPDVLNVSSKKLADEYTSMDDEKRTALLEDLQAFLGGVYFSQGSGKHEPIMPEALASYDSNLIAFLVHWVPASWKFYHWHNGWMTRSQEERLYIESEMRKQKEAMDYYSHLPAVGDEITMIGASGKREKRIVDETILVTLRNMVDRGALPGNPIFREMREPDVTSEEIIARNLVEKKLKRKSR